MGSRPAQVSEPAPGGFAMGVLFWVAIWLIVAHAIGNDLLLAGPFDTLGALVRSLGELPFWAAVGSTSLRIVVTGAASAAAGAALGALAWRFRIAQQLLAPALQVMKSAPVACVIVIVLVAWGAAGALIVIVAFVALPPFYVAMQQALDERPRGTERVLQLAGVGRLRIFLACTWPDALPFFTAASKTAVALSWRAGITAELLCLPLGSIGAGVYAAKLTLSSSELLVWTIVVMLLSWLTEKAVLGLLRLSARSQQFALHGLPPRAEHRAAAPSSGAGSALALADISKAFGDQRIAEALNLRIAGDERVCLMAPTGTGKSTLLHLLMGMEAPDAGTVEAPAKLGAMLQQPSLIGGLSAYQNVLLAAAPGTDPTEVRATLAELLPTGTIDRPARELSGGTMRLTELARALFSNGDALVLDEPFAGLDAASRLRAGALILQLQSGRPLIVATHDPADIKLLDAQRTALEPSPQSPSADEPFPNARL